MPEENTTPAEEAHPGPDESGPDALPPHEVLEEIERGSWLVVHRARDLTHDRLVALHDVLPGLLPPEHVGAFLREVRAAAQVRHPHLLPILAVGRREGRPCCTTPLAVNSSLSERRDQFREPRAAADLIEKLAGATAAAHAHGMLHGALKPTEVRFDENDQPRIGAFGVAPFFFALAQSRGGLILGNPVYCAPELLTGPSGFGDASIDVWALGVILYELLTGRRPFEGGGTDVVRRIASEGPVPPRRLLRDLDRDLEAVVLHCLEKRPADRYPSARALAEDLERWRLGQPTAVRPPTLTQRLLRAFRGNAP